MAKATDPAAAGARPGPAGPPPGELPGAPPGRAGPTAPGLADYLWGVAAVVGALGLVIAGIVGLLAVTGFDPCGCTRLPVP
jgi:hypothetical protein